MHVPGNEVYAPGNEVKVPGNEVYASGNEVKVPGNEVNASGNEVQVPGNEMQVSENCENIKCSLKIEKYVTKYFTPPTYKKGF